jgi:hypothetical protein
MKPGSRTNETSMNPAEWRWIHLDRDLKPLPGQDLSQLPANLPTRAELDEMDRKKAAERAMWTALWPQLLEKYDGMFVAVVGGEVVVADAHLQSLVDRIKSGGWRLDETAIEFVAREPRKLYL